MNDNITIKDYTLFKSLGKGTFGEVFLTIKKNSSDLFATKVIDLNKLKKNGPLMQKHLENEIQIMKQLDHPNIIKLYDDIRTNDKYYLIIEYCNGGSLLDLLNQYKKKYKRSFSIKLVQYFMKQIIEGLAYIHSKNIIHRDIKLVNILVKFRNILKKNKTESININDLEESDFFSSTIKIIDFGVSIKLENGLAKTFAGTLVNMAPQVLEKRKGYNEKADIWSLGTIFYQMLTGEQLFNVDIFEKLEKGEYSIPIDIELSNETISFLKSMLQYNEESRASAKELLKHDFLTKNTDNFTKMTFEEEVPDKVDMSYLIINTIKNSQLRKYVNNNKDNSPLIIQKYTEGLLDDYKTAKEYFKKNNLPEQEKNAEKKCIEIEKILKIVNNGNKINLTSLPKPINPEYIYNCSTIERNNKFKEILSEFRGEKNLLEIKIKSFERKNINKTSREEYEKSKNNYQQLGILIEDFEKLLKNVWAPAPKYIKEKKDIVIEKISYDKCEFKIQVNVQTKKDANFNITLLVNEDKKLIKNVDLNFQNNFHEGWIWILNENEWMNVDNNTDNFILGIETGIHILNIDFDNRKSNIDISKIKNGNPMSFKQQLPNSSESNIIDISIKPILPKGKIIKSKESKKFLRIIKVYPPFEFESSSNSSYKPTIFNLTFKKG